MRIALFVGSFPSVSETFILRQITGLIDLGHTIHIFAEERPEPSTPIHPEVRKYDLLSRVTYLEDEIPAASGYWEMPVWPLSEQTWLPGADEGIPNERRALDALPAIAHCALRVPKLFLKVMNPQEYGYQAVSLAPLYRLYVLERYRGEFDIAHAHFGPHGQNFRMVRELWDVPFVVSFHGYDFSTYPRAKGRDVYKALFATCDAVTVNSDYTRQRLIALKCPPEKLHELPVGLAPNEFPFHERSRKRSEPVRVLSVGRLVEIKGHEFAIRAVGRIIKQHPLLHYDIVGEGPARAKLEKLIAELGLTQHVTLHGACDGDQVRTLMAESHIFMLTSVSVEGDQEGQGLALQEAQASGLPVIATRHGAFPEGLLPGKSGFLVPERDVDRLMETMSNLIEHPETWGAIGRAGRDFVVSKYDIAMLNRSLVDLYQKLLQLHPHTTNSMAENLR